MKMAKKMLVLAIVATGTLMGSVGTGSAVASPGDPLQGIIISLRGETTGTVKSKGTKKTSASRKRRSVRARNAERRRQRQLKRQRERLLDEFRAQIDVLSELVDEDGGELLELLVVAVEEGDVEMAMDVIGELESLDGSYDSFIIFYDCRLVIWAPWPWDWHIYIGKQDCMGRDNDGGHAPPPPKFYEKGGDEGYDK